MAFSSRDQFILRRLVLGGDCVYILYYYFAPEDSAVGRNILERHVHHRERGYDLAIFVDEMQSSLPAGERKLFDLLVDLTPGQFRKL